MATYDVAGRSAIVTGGGSGIGRAVALLLGEKVEHQRTEDLFLNPTDERTARYIEGRYG